MCQLGFVLRLLVCITTPGLVFFFSFFFLQEVWECVGGVDWDENFGLKKVVDNGWKPRWPSWGTWILVDCDS